MMFSVCGHTHTEAYVQFFVGKKYKVFGMQVGCGVDENLMRHIMLKTLKGKR